MDNYTCFIISNKPHLVPEIQKSIFPVEVKHFDGTDYPSFSKLVNSCVNSSPTEIVILMSDKVRPKQTDVIKLLNLLDEGFAFVALYRLAFFGFKKELLRQVGMFDERYVGGGYEDDDFYIRLKEANLGCYITDEIEYHKSKSSWNYSLAKGHFIDKWGDQTKFAGTATRFLDEEQYSNYNLGKSTKASFKQWEESIINSNRVKKYVNIEIKKDNHE
jgi:predicted glycosyltransferase involved in capsule biosynthesis